jgi:hypothetical protein
MLSQNLSAAETDVILMYLRPEDAFQHIASFFLSETASQILPSVIRLPPPFPPPFTSPPTPPIQAP